MLKYLMCSIFAVNITYALNDIAVNDVPTISFQKMATPAMKVEDALRSSLHRTQPSL